MISARGGLGAPAVPGDAIALVEEAPDGTITQEEYDRALEQASSRPQLKPPPPSDPQYTGVADAAQSDLLLTRWVIGEAEERGIEVSDRQITEELDKISRSSSAPRRRSRSSSTSRASRSTRRDSGELSCSRADPAGRAAGGRRRCPTRRSRTTTTRTRTSSSSPRAATSASILNKDQAEVEKAKAVLGKRRLAADLAEGREAVLDRRGVEEPGGLRQGVVAGQSEPDPRPADLLRRAGELVGRSRARATT